MEFQTIHTLYGLARMATAQATGVPINLTHMAVGDGNGNPVFPLETQTQLVREIAGTRVPVNSVWRDPDEPTRFTAEMIFPAGIGGFVAREIGIYDDAGGLFAVANCPNSYIPLASEGAFGDGVVRMEFLVTNANVVTLKVDPNVIVATRSWIIQNISIGKLMPGGLTNQVWRKKSNADGDGHWVDPTTVNVVVTTIEEEQTLAAGQTVVDLVVTNTVGLALYVNGDRLPAQDHPNGWKPDDLNMTRLHLGKSYAAGAKLIAVQNEPASRLEAVLQQDLNLSDLEDKAAARGHLGVYSKEESDAAGQPGDLKYTFRSTAPPGYLKANGANVSRSAYPELFATIGTTYGEGDGFNTFGLPDVRGEFIRAWDDERGVDLGRQLGTLQVSQNLAHTHGGSTTAGGGHSHSYVDYRVDVPPGRALAGGNDHHGIWERQGVRETAIDGYHSHGLSIASSGGTEARPRNIALLACIKY